MMESVCPHLFCIRIQFVAPLESLNALSPSGLVEEDSLLKNETEKVVVKKGQ